MDFQHYGIDERLIRAAENRNIKTVLYERMLEHTVLHHESVCAKISLSDGIEEVCLLPALQWFAAASEGAEGPPSRRKILVAVPDAASATKAAKAASGLGSGLGARVCLILDGEPSESASAPILEGDPSAEVVVGTPATLLAAAQGGHFKLRDYGIFVALGLDRMAELPSEFTRKFSGSLLPSWERRSILAAAKLSVKAKNLAWDLADNPTEIRIEEEVAVAQGVPKETWHVAMDSKFRFLLGLLGREGAERICVFCNLKSTAEEVSRRLEANDIGSDYLLGALAVDRKLAILAKTKTGTCRVLVLTDQGAEGLPSACFPLLVNYDIPLEPEYFVRRLDLLDRSSHGAKIVNIACDRYVYGLTAVEQYIAAKLEAKPVDDSLLAGEDKSEGMTFDRGRREDTRREYGGVGSRGAGHRGGRYRDARRDGDPADDDRSPGIRRSISEATGGSLDMDAISQPPRSEEPARREARGDGQRDAQRRGANPRETNLRDARHGSGNRRGGAQKSPSKSGAHRDERNHGSNERGRRGPSQGNPYDLPMEERMRLYREKYGRRLENERSDEKRGARSEGPSRDARRDARRDAPRPARPEASRAGASTPDSQAEPKNGLLGRLFGSFLRKD